MSEKFIPTQPIGTTDGPDSPLVESTEVNQTENPSGSRNYCVYNGKKYSPGSHVCHEGMVYTCYVNGFWVKTGPECM